MLTAPAASLVFSDFPRVMGYIRSLGVAGFHPVLPYADITVWAYHKIISKNPGIKLISSACAGMNLYFSKTGRAYAGHLASVFSPLLCAARYLKNYRRVKEPFAFLSPCRLKKNEFKTRDNEELVRYNITIDALKKRLEADSVDISRYAPHHEETDICGAGLTAAAFGGISGALAALLPGIDCHIEEGLENAVSYLSNNDGFPGRRVKTVIFEPYACKGGCANGSGVGGQKPRDCGSFLKTQKTADVKTIYKLFAHYDATLKLKDFCR
ncbi:MAG: hypothetical protein LBP37_05330 [Spirochaetaceae bacterium]|nr:hypothetical protein [Spirochaetaceae bacterium]